MRAVVHLDLIGDSARVLAWLAADPVGNGVPLGLLRGLIDGRAVGDGPARMIHVEDDGGVVGMALQTDPDRRLVLSSMPSGALPVVATALHAAEATLPGVVGPVPAAGEFALAWTQLTGQRSELAMAQRLYRLDQVIPPVGVAGAGRDARLGDLEMVCSWATAMADDIGLDVNDRDPRLTEQITHRIQDRRLRLWEVAGEVVSMAGPSRPAAGVVRIGLVYTPRDHRRHGYAAACVADESRRAFQDGASACTLFTDLSNPTSNGVYQRIGYYPVSDAEELTFLD